MGLDERLLELRKKEHLSQEEVADKLNVSRQTVSKWETGQSTPDFDKILPLCELFNISTDELIKGEKEDEERVVVNNTTEIRKKRAKGIGIGILSYFIAVVWIMIAIPVLFINPIVASGIFLLIGGIGTTYIVYTCIVYKKEKEKKDEDPLLKKIESIVSMITLTIYLLVSFATMAWHITWILWIIYALVIEIIKLMLMLKENKNEE